MRIELPQQTEERLDKVKRAHHILGKGHADTVRFLLDFHERHKAVEKVLDERLVEVETLIERGMLKALRTIVLNVLKETDP